MQFRHWGFAFLFMNPLNLEDRSCLKNFDNIYKLETRNGVYLSALHPSEDKKNITYSYTEVVISTQNEWLYTSPRKTKLELGESLYEPHSGRQEWVAVTCAGDNRLVQRRVYRDTAGVRNEKYGRPSLIAQYIVWDYFEKDRRVSRSTQSEHYYSPKRKGEIEANQLAVLQGGSENGSAKQFCTSKSVRVNRHVPPSIEAKDPDRHTCYIGVIDRLDSAEEWRKKGVGPYSTNEFSIELTQPGANDFEFRADALLRSYESKIRYRR